MKKVKIRIAVAIAKNGKWCASGAANETDDVMMDIALMGLDEEDATEYYVEAELDIPEAKTVQGKAEQPTVNQGGTE